MVKIDFFTKPKFYIDGKPVPEWSKPGEIFVQRNENRLDAAICPTGERPPCHPSFFLSLEVRSGRWRFNWIYSDKQRLKMLR